MNTILVQYKKREWSTWVSWPCHSQSEADTVRAALRAEGYEVK